MPKRILPLREIKVRNAKPQEKEYKIFDGEGLYILVTATGGKLWRLKYKFAGKEKLLSLGSYPEVSPVPEKPDSDVVKRGESGICGMHGCHPHG